MIIYTGALQLCLPVQEKCSPIEVLCSPQKISNNLPSVNQYSSTRNEVHVNGTTSEELRPPHGTQML